MPARDLLAAIAVALIFPLLMYFGISVLHPAPRPQYYISMPAATGSDAMVGQAAQPAETRRSQERAYEAAMREYGRSTFTSLAPLGVAAFLIGILVPLYAVGVGLIAGGTLTFGVGYASFVRYESDWLVASSIVVAVLIAAFVAYQALPPRRRSLERQLNTGR